MNKSDQVEESALKRGSFEVARLKEFNFAHKLRSYLQRNLPLKERTGTSGLLIWILESSEHSFRIVRGLLELRKSDFWHSVRTESGTLVDRVPGPGGMNQEFVVHWPAAPNIYQCGKSYTDLITFAGYGQKKSESVDGGFAARTQQSQASHSAGFGSWIEYIHRASFCQQYLNLSGLQDSVAQLYKDDGLLDQSSLRRLLARSACDYEFGFQCMYMHSSQC